MSFGKSQSVRLDADGKKPLVFWDHQQNQTNKPKKKFSYKEKGNNIPLRDSLNKEDPEPMKYTRPPPKGAAVKPEPTSKPRGNTQRAPTTQNGRTGASNKGKTTQKQKGKPPVPDDKVTLTQSQFDRILETIGELTLLAEEKENIDAVGATDLPEPTTSIDVNQPTHKSQEALPSHTQTSEEVPVHETSTGVPKLDINSPRYPDPRSVPQGPVTGNTRASLVGVPFAHMTKAERKRLEWERQKAEDAALQKQVNHTEKLHGVTTQQATTTLQRQAVSENINNLELKTQNEDNARVASRSSVIVNEPVAIPGLNVPLGDQSNQSVPVASPAVVNSEPVSVPGLSIPQQTAAVVQHTLNVRANAIPPQTLATPQQSNTVAPSFSNVPQQAAAVVQPAPSAVPQPQVTTRGPPTKAELKRLQWEKERADLAKQQDWDPWGKPGAGAPITDNHGNLLADFSTRKSPEEERSLIDETPQSTSFYTPVSEEAIRQSFEDVQRRKQVQQQHHPGQIQHPQASVQQPGPTTATYPQQQHQQPGALATASQPPAVGATEAPPAAIRSSFNVGAIAPDENKYLSAKEQQRREWLADLEKQREEQRLRKLQQIQIDAELDMKDMGYKDSYKPTAPDHQIPQAAQISQATQPTYTSSVQQPTQQSQQGTYQPATQPAQYPATQVAQHAHNTGPLPSGEPSQPQMDTFLRGQNVNMDDVTRRELEQKRKKQLEYQEYIKQQMNEKEHQKQVEREKKWREEIELEQKLQRERDELQNQTISDKDKQRQREDNDRRRTEMLKSAMEQEKDRADWEKHEKRMLKLRKGGHDVSGYHASFQSKHTPRDGATSVLTVAPSFVPGLGNITTATAATTSVHNQRDNAPSQMTSYPSPLPVDAETRHVDMRGSQPNEQQYIENRVLTPSVYRSLKKEFGVQTDLLGLESMSRESTEIEYKGPIKKKVRVKSAAELKALKAAREKKAGFGSSVARPTEPPKSAPVPNKVKQVKPILKKTYKKPIPVNKRAAWGSSANANKKKVVKQSERDPFYEEKKRQSEEKGLLRQQMLLEIAEQEAPLVYNKSTAAARARSRSKGRVDEEFEAPGAVHVSTTKVISRSRSRSQGGGGGVSSTGHRSRVDSRSDRGYSSQRSNSPPVPALKNRIVTGDITDSGRGSPASYRRKTPTDYAVIDQYSYENYSRNSRLEGAGSRIDSHRGDGNKKYSDKVIDAPLQNGQFVPFIRSTNILNPAQAEEPLPLSREPSTMHRARQAYVQEHEPAKYGTAMENFNDSRIKENVPVQTAPTYNKDPIINPSVVKDHPSQRQNRILQQLSDLRQGLMQKQRELEVGLQAEEVVG